MEIYSPVYKNTGMAWYLRHAGLVIFVSTVTLGLGAVAGAAWLG